MLTSGGDSPGMNAALRSIVRCGMAEGLTVYGIKRGYAGLLEGVVEEMTSRSVSNLMYRGGSALGSARCPEMLEDHAPEAAARILKRRNVDGLIVIGGDGTYRGALKISEHGIPVVGLPGTIDNDIPGTDATIGFDTACDTLSWVIQRLRDTAETHHRTFVVEAMGRKSGWLALYGGLAGGADIILIPEIQWTLEGVLEKLETRRREGRTFNLVVLAEGAGRATDLVRDIQDNLAAEQEVRACIPGHIQRGGVPSTRDRILASLMGQRAIQALLDGYDSHMIGERQGRLVEVPLKESTEGTASINRDLYELAVLVS